MTLLIDNKAGIIVDAAETRANRSVEIAVTQTMMDRVERRFEINDWFGINPTFAAAILPRPENAPFCADDCIQPSEVSCVVAVQFQDTFQQRAIAQDSAQFRSIQPVAASSSESHWLIFARAVARGTSTRTSL